MNEIISAELSTHIGTQSRGAPLAARIAAALSRMRFQLLGGVICAILLPAVLRGRLEQLPDQIASYDNSIIGTVVAFGLGYVLFRKLTGYPGIRTVGYVLPSFAVAYCAIVVLFFLLRLDYSRYQFLASFAFSSAWMIFCVLVVEHFRKLTLAIVPVGRVDRLHQMSGFDWKTLSDWSNVEQPHPIVADLRADMPEHWERFIAQSALAGRPVYHVKQIFESVSGRVQVESLSENRFGSLAPNTIYAPAKFYLDWITAAIALVFSAPLLVGIAIAVRLDSAGPAIFRQTRMGYLGKPFTIYKFRSMSVSMAGHDARDQAMTKNEDDRITRFGGFLRKSRLDELPQLINILRGEMSWIGPRPEAMALSEWYESELPFYTYRHLVRPGVTGWAQVKQGHVTDLKDADEKLQFDFFYVRNLSLWLDMLVLLETIKIVLTGKGAR